MLDFVTEYKLALLYVGLIVGGTPGLVAAIYFSLVGVYSLTSVFVACIVTTVAWDGFWYGVGRFIMLERLKKISFLKERLHLIERMEHHYRNHAYKLIFLSRFVYGTNSPISIVSGAHRISFYRFIAVSVGSIGGWFLALSIIGLLLRPSLDEIEGIAKNLTIGFTVFVALMPLVYITVKHLITKRVNKLE